MHVCACMQIAICIYIYMYTVLYLIVGCKDCGLSYKEECEIHCDGGVVSISDGKAPSRARMSLPSCLSLKKIPGTNEGYNTLLYIMKLNKCFYRHQT